MKKRSPHIFSGCGTALITPFCGDRIDYSAYETLIERQISEKADAIIVCGTTGEAPTLTDREQTECIRFAVDTAAGRMPVIAGTGSNSTKHAVYMSKAAEQCGADAVLAVSPYYNKATESGLIANYTAIADAVDIPVIIYNVPSRTGVDIPVSVYEKLVRHPNIKGIKEASSDPGKMMETVLRCGEYADIFTGCDEMLFYSLSCGAAGVISVVSNIIPKEVSEACRDYRSRRIKKAAEYQSKYSDLISAMFTCVNPIPVKTALSLMGYGNGQPRLPLTVPDEKALGIIKSALSRHSLI